MRRCAFSECFHLCQGKTWHLRLCDIFSGLTEKLGVRVTAEVDPKTVIFMETSEVSPAFPLTQNSTLQKKKKKKKESASVPV